MKIYTTLLIIIISSALCSSQTPKKVEMALINGKNIYYEVYGSGEPLFLLHGYTLSSRHWLPYIDDFKDNYEVYVVDLPGHGKSDAFADTLSIKSVAQDVNALVDYLNLDTIKAIGFSFGGDILYQLAVINPTRITSMITIGAVGTWTIDDFPEYPKIFNYENRAKFPWLLDYHGTDSKVKALMEQFLNYKVHLTTEELRSLKPKVLIMLGDEDDGVNLEEVARVKKNVPNSSLWILPNVDHGAHEGETKEEFLIKARAFLSNEK